MRLLLVSKTTIVKQIFSLICKKLNLELSIQDNSEINDKYDFIILDEEFIDDRFNIIKQSTKKIAAICAEELPFDKSRDFIIPRPFLPTKLEELILEQMEIIKLQDMEEQAQNKIETFENFQSFESAEDDITVPITDYVESLAEDVYLDIEEENDESIVSLSALNDGGILDVSELGKINDILKQEEIQNEINFEQNDWKNINQILDDALDEVREYEFDLNDDIEKEDNSYSIVLEKYDMEELKPLLLKFNEEIITKLSNSQSVDIKFKLKD